MHKLFNTTGSPGDIQTSGDTGNIAKAFTDVGKNFYKELINSANSIPILNIFKYYGLNIDAVNRKIICPFPGHKSGNEITGSFMYYPDTNTFWCFGCKIGVACCDFVANMDGINKVKAANKILSIFNSDDVELSEINRINYSERLDIMIEFSTTIRDFRNIYCDEKSFEFIENICLVYDQLNVKHNLTNEALKSITDQLKQKIALYGEKCQY